MKKVTSLLLALVMALALAVPAFAEGTTIQPSKGDSSKNVEATYTNEKDSVVHKYDFTISWAPVPAFSYKFKGTVYTWKTDTLSYEATGTTGEEGWANNGTGDITLKVLNRSDMAVNCEATLVKNIEQPEGLNVTYTKASSETSAAAAISVEDGHWGEYTAENSGQVKECDLSGTIAVTGVPNKSATTLATITVTVSK